MPAGALRSLSLAGLSSPAVLELPHVIPAITNREPCPVAARKMPHGYAHNWYLRSGAKRVMFHCAPTEKRIVIAR